VKGLTLPNAICVFRFIGSLALLPLALGGRVHAFVALLIVLALSDWIDGKIARWFDRKSAIGPLLDTIADGTFYLAVFVGLLIMDQPMWVEQGPYLAAAGGTYGLSVAACLIRFGRWPSYHTRAAKTCWLLIGIGLIVHLLGGPAWLLSAALIAVAAANVEATLITLLLPKRESDVPSIVTALRRRRTSKHRGRPTYDENGSTMTTEKGNRRSD